MKILITGATGLIGTELVTFLLQKQHKIHYLTTSQDKLVNTPNYKGFYWNPDQGIIDSHCLEGVETIINLSGATIFKRWTKSYKEKIIKSRIESSNLLFKTLQETPNHVKQVISSSGVGIYPYSLTAIYTEETKKVSNSFLGDVVLKWEDAVNRLKQLHIKVCILRTGMVLAEQGGVWKEMMKPTVAGCNIVFGSGEQFQSWIHIEDLVIIYHTAIQNEWEGIYNAVAPNVVTSNQLMTYFGALFKKKLFLIRIPELITKFILGEVAVLLLDSQNVSANKIIGTGFIFKYEKINKAFENLIYKKSPYL